MRPDVKTTQAIVPTIGCNNKNKMLDQMDFSEIYIVGKRHDNE